MHVKKNLETKQDELIQDCETRWNSKYQMLCRLVQQKEAILELVASNRTRVAFQQLNGRWPKNMFLFLALNESTTKASSNSLPTMSMVYPMVKTIENTLKKRLADRLPGAMFCKSLLQSIKTRFTHIKSDNNYQACMAIDPHFKCALLQPQEKLLLKESLATKAIVSLYGIHLQEKNYSLGGFRNSTGSDSTSRYSKA